jgi:hypothetical protein
MEIIKLGTINTIEGRTGVKEGDLFCIYFPSENENNGLLFSICRHNKNGPHQNLRFEGDDNKAIIKGYEGNDSGAYLFMMLISQITGLQAKFVHKKKGSITFLMKKGEGLILHEDDISK